jgi:hypothetical protein
MCRRYIKLKGAYEGVTNTVTKSNAAQPQWNDGTCHLVDDRFTTTTATGTTNTVTTQVICPETGWFKRVDLIFLGFCLLCVCLLFALETCRSGPKLRAFQLSADPQNYFGEPSCRCRGVNKCIRNARLCDGSNDCADQNTWSPLVNGTAELDANGTRCVLRPPALP